MFQKEIGFIKQYAEKQFVEALLHFNQCRVESHAKKLERAKSDARHRNKTFVNSRTEGALTRQRKNGRGPIKSGTVPIILVKKQ